MKLLLFTLASIAFIGVGVFGMLTMQMDGHGNCMVSDLQGDECPASDAFFTNIAEHFSIFGALSAAVFFCLTLLLVSGYFRTSIRFVTDQAKRIFHVRLPVLKPSIHKFERWLSFHENSPSSI